LSGGLGTVGETFAQVLWGFHFVIGVLFAMAFRAIYEKVRKSEKYEIEYMNDFLLQRIGGGVFDFMVAASIAGISFTVIQEYIWPIIILTTIGGFFTAGYTIWFGKRIYEKAPLEHIVTFFGMHTGTLSTGMALLREVDPTFESGTAEDMVFGSGLALFLGIPMLILLNIPILGYRMEQPIYYLYFILGLAAYIGAMYFFWFRKAKIRGKEKKS
jgi:ESS family glutamate:Na+ symporter